MKKQLYAIVGGTFVVPLMEISADDMDLLNKCTEVGFAAIPVYWSEGKGVWPPPSNNVVVVREV